MKSVSYLWEVGGCLHGVCELYHSLEACWWLSAQYVPHQLFVGGWWLSAWVMWTASFPLGRYAVVCRSCTLLLTLRKVGGFMHGVCELYQLLEAGWWLSVVGCVYSVSYLRQDCCCLHGVCTLSIKYGALAVVCSRVCNLTVTWGRLVVVCRWVCNLYVTWGRLEVVCRWVCNLSTWGRLAVVCRGCEICQYGYKYGVKRMQRIQLIIEGRICDVPDTNTN
jgi:hypothetical protein